MTVPVGTIVREAPCRETGATIVVERTGDGSWIEQEEGWATLCLHHSNVVIHDTRTDAEGWATQPSMWCEGCREITEGKLPRIKKGDVPVVDAEEETPNHDNCVACGEGDETVTMRPVGANRQAPLCLTCFESDEVHRVLMEED